MVATGSPSLTRLITKTVEIANLPDTSLRLMACNDPKPVVRPELATFMYIGSRRNFGFIHSAGTHRPSPPPLLHTEDMISSLNSLKGAYVGGIVYGSTIGAIKGATRSLGYSSHGINNNLGSDFAGFLPGGRGH